MEVVEDFESRPHRAVSFEVAREPRRCRNGTSESCRMCFLVTVEEGCQEGARTRAAETNERQKSKAERGTLGIK